MEAPPGFPNRATNPKLQLGKYIFQVKNKTQVLDAIEKYFNDLYTSASSAAQEEYNSFIQELRLPKL